MVLFHSSRETEIGGTVHTPGPWSVSESMGLGMSVTSDNDRLFIGHAQSADLSTTKATPLPWETQKANAKLMASALEMLECLREIRQLLGTESMGGSPSR